MGGITLCMANRMDTAGDITLPHGRPAKGRPSATVCAQPAPGKPTCSMPGNRPLALRGREVLRFKPGVGVAAKQLQILRGNSMRGVA